MSLKLHVIILLVGMLAPLTAYASRQGSIYDVVNHPIPAVAQELPLDAIAVAAGGARTGWRVAPGDNGMLSGSLEVRDKHHATVSIAYSQKSFSITLVSSVNFLQEGNLIHRDYNRWAHEREKNIGDQLTIVASAMR